MPTFKQPIEQARLSGAAKVHPERHGGKIPKSKLPLGEAPEHLSKDAAECWFEISSIALPGVMTGADRLLLEVKANHLADYRKDPSGYPTTRLNQFILCLARFGMSPSDRTKLGVEDKAKDNPFANLDD